MKKIFIASILLALVLTGCKLGGNKEVVITPEEASQKAAEYINTNLMQSGSEVTVKEVVEEGGLYKVIVSLPDGQEIDSFMTKNGKKFFPQGFDTEEPIEEEEDDSSSSNQNVPIAQAATKSDKPSVELFVMSHCPYGTQMEKGIIPVVEALGDKIDFELKFCDYAMHGEKEIDEQLEQYCVQKEFPDKLLAYLKCFLDSGDTSDACFSKVGVDKSKIDSCVASTDETFKVKESFADQSSWKNGRYPEFAVYAADASKYGVQGSPTLVVNGGQLSASRDSSSLLKSICSGFNNPPEECSKQLSSAAPSPGFGFGGTGSNTDASCN